MQCNQCDEPKCVTSCPADATWKTETGVVTIDYEACTGCSACVVACPYGARTYLDEDDAFDESDALDQQIKRANELGTVTKCDFCIEKVQDGREDGLTPGEDPAATPHCVNSCIGDARTFGDLDDEDSLIARRLEQEEVEPLQPEAETDPNVYYKR